VGEHERIEGVVNDGVGLEVLGVAQWRGEAVAVADGDLLPGGIPRVGRNLDGTGDLRLEFAHLEEDESAGFIDDVLLGGDGAVGAEELVGDVDGGAGARGGAAEGVENICPRRTDFVEGAGKKFGRGVVVRLGGWRVGGVAGEDGQDGAEPSGERLERSRLDEFSSEEMMPGHRGCGQAAVLADDHHFAEGAYGACSMKLTSWRGCERWTLVQDI